jgi:rod shape-determining protein MreC
VRKQGKKSIFFVAIITLVLLSLLIFSSIPGSPIASWTGPVSFLTDPVQRTFGRVAERVRGFFSSVREGERIRLENVELKDENARLQMQVKELEENGRRWEELKAAFLIRDLFSDYELIGASVLTREIGDWFDMFRISAGTRDGIQIDDETSFAVVDAGMNLVGRVYSSDLTSAKIMPVINEGSVISAKLNTAGGSIVRVRGDVILKEDNLCLVDNIADFSVLHIGDEVITSGLGGLFPPGIPIGVIVELRHNDPKVEKTAVLKVYAEYKTMKDVFVMKGKPIG